MSRNYCLQIAANMLSNGDEKGETRNLNKYLKDDLIEIDKMVKKAGGILMSRQVIAHAILEWKAKNTRLTAYFPSIADPTEQSVEGEESSDQNEEVT